MYGFEHKRQINKDDAKKSRTSDCFFFFSKRGDDENFVNRAAAGLKYVCHCRDCQVHHSPCRLEAGAARGEAKTTATSG